MTRRRRKRGPNPSGPRSGPGNAVLARSQTVSDLRSAHRDLKGLNLDVELGSKRNLVSRIKEEGEPASPAEAGLAEEVGPDKPPSQQDETATEPNKVDPAVMQMTRLAEELLSSERSYIAGLAACMRTRDRLLHLVALRRQLLSIEEISVLFGNINEIHSLSANLAADLTELRFQRRLLKDTAKILKKYIPFFKTYTKYVSMFPEATHLLEVLRSDSAKFEAFLELEQLCAGNQRLDSLMILPIQRVPRYLLLLRQMHKYADRAQSSPETIAELSECISALDEVAHFLEEARKHQEDRAAVVRLQKEVFHDRINLLTPTRFYVKVGVLKKVHERRRSGLLLGAGSPWKKYLFLLFSDILIYAARPLAGSVAEFRHALPLSGLKLAECHSEHSEDKETAFRLWNTKYHGTKHLTLICANGAARQEWMDEISKYIELADRNAETLKHSHGASVADLEREIVGSHYVSRERERSSSPVVLHKRSFSVSNVEGVGGSALPRSASPTPKRKDSHGEAAAAAAPAASAAPLSMSRDEHGTPSGNGGGHAEPSSSSSPSNSPTHFSATAAVDATGSGSGRWRRASSTLSALVGSLGRKSRSPSGVFPPDGHGHDAPAAGSASDALPPNGGRSHKRRRSSPHLAELFSPRSRSGSSVSGASFSSSSQIPGVRPVDHRPASPMGGSSDEHPPPPLVPRPGERPGEHVRTKSAGILVTPPPRSQHVPPAAGSPLSGSASARRRSRGNPGNPVQMAAARRLHQRMASTRSVSAGGHGGAAGSPDGPERSLSASLGSGRRPSSGLSKAWKILGEAPPVLSKQGSARQLVQDILANKHDDWSDSESRVSATCGSDSDRDSQSSLGVDDEDYPDAEAPSMRVLAQMAAAKRRRMSVVVVPAPEPVSEYVEYIESLDI